MKNIFKEGLRKTAELSRMDMKGKKNIRALKHNNIFTFGQHGGTNAAPRETNIEVAPRGNDKYPQKNDCSNSIVS